MMYGLWNVKQCLNWQNIEISQKYTLKQGALTEPQKEFGVSGQSSGQEQNGSCGTPPNWVLKTRED